MPRKKSWIARLAKTLTYISQLFAPLEKIGYGVLALVGCVMVISLSILGAIDLLVRVWRVM